MSFLKEVLSMIDGKYAIYNNETYKVVSIHGNEVLLVTEDERAEEQGFIAQTKDHTLHTLYYKHVARDDLEELYELFQEARYEGAIFDYYQDSDGNQYIGTNDKEKANTFGLSQVDDSYYNKIVNDDEIDKIINRSHIE
jgi:hypothetical protein